MVLHERVLGRRTLLAGGTLAMAALTRKSNAAEVRPFSAAVVSSATRAVPALSFTDADGAPKTLADYAGKAIVLNLWATWCVPCVAEMPDLDKLSGLLGADFAVLPLSSDRAGAPVVEAFYKAHGIGALPVLLDHQGAMMHLLGARGIPTTLLIDRQGQERTRIEGAVAWTDAANLAALHDVLG